VLRCFAGEVTHVEGTVDPIRDADTVDTELMLADLESLEKRADATAKKARGGDKESKQFLAVMEPVLEALRAGRPARSVALATEQKPLLRQLQLMTSKPVLYACNMDEAAAATGNEWSRKVEARAKEEGAEAVVISAAIEAEVALLTDPKDKQEFLASLNLTEAGLDRVIRAGYHLLHLITFFTVGPKEARAWTVHRGAKAPEAAGVIHTDFERGFIRSETIGYDDFVTLGGEQPAKDAGKMRSEGKDYVVQDGDIVHFRFNV